MSRDPTLHQRRRAPTPAELAGIPWLALLSPAEREIAVADLKIGEAQPGDLICRIGRPVTYWFGVVDGLLKMSGENADG
ncbi:MAG: Crp/Fnr family transcriptional regulator, partial [Burkholderiales bacterium]|nr:Crp/Fnr family transcriptional regulator [Burkholderiales bacterium]